jgi:hypothetical protein
LSIAAIMPASMNVRKVNTIPLNCAIKVCLRFHLTLLYIKRYTKR